MRVGLAAAVIAALGGAGCWTSAAAPPPTRPVVAPVVIPAAPAAPAPGAQKIEPISCADVGVILRGPAPRKGGAGRAKERAIQQACTDSAWPRDVIDCVGRGKRDCLEQLTAAQRGAYDGQLEQWRSQEGVGGGGGEGGGEGGGGDVDGDDSDDSDDP